MEGQDTRLNKARILFKLPVEQISSPLVPVRFHEAVVRFRGWRNYYLSASFSH